MPRRTLRLWKVAIVHLLKALASKLTETQENDSEQCECHFIFGDQVYRKIAYAKIQYGNVLENIGKSESHKQEGRDIRVAWFLTDTENRHSDKR